MPHFFQPWLKMETEHLSQAYGALPARDIAGNLDRTRGSVYQKAHRLGFSTPKSPSRPTDPATLEIRSLFEQGRSLKEVLVLFPTSTEAVWNEFWRFYRRRKKREQK